MDEIVQKGVADRDGLTHEELLCVETKLSHPISNDLLGFRAINFTISNKK